MSALELPSHFSSTRDFIASVDAQLLVIPFCPWRPQEGFQKRFLLDLGREALGGGAAGPGKSTVMLMAASQFLDVPGYSALLLRKTFQDLMRPKALMSLAEEWWAGKPGVRFDRDRHSYRFACPGGGESSITFGSLDKAYDRYKYQGSAFVFIGFDELTQFPEADYRYLHSRLRRSVGGPLEHIPLRMRSTSNPGGRYHNWVYERFVAPWEAWQTGHGPKPQKAFHPAKLEDNPALDRDDYILSLSELDPVTRAQLLNGDWHIRSEGRMFQRDWFQLVERTDIPGNARWARGWDMAATDPVPGNDPDWTVGLLMGLDPEGRYYITDMRRWRKGPAKTEELCRTTALADTYRVTQLLEQEPGSAGKAMARHLRTGAFRASNFLAVPSSGKSRGRVTTIAPGRHTSIAKILAATPLASHAEAGDVFLVADGTWDHESFLEEVEVFPDGIHDDCADAASITLNYLARHPVIAPNFGDANDDLRQESYWAPKALSSAPDWERRFVDEPSQRPRTAEELRIIYEEIFHV